MNSNIKTFLFTSTFTFMCLSTSCLASDTDINDTKVAPIIAEQNSVTQREMVTKELEELDECPAFLLEEPAPKRNRCQQLCNFIAEMLKPNFANWNLSQLTKIEKTS